jgi:hypothetical protein
LRSDFIGQFVRHVRKEIGNDKLFCVGELCVTHSVSSNCRIARLTSSLRRVFSWKDDPNALNEYLDGIQVSSRTR